MPEQTKRLYRSKSNKVIAGVCGGIAEYFDIDPTVVRVACVLISILPLIPGIILYIIAWIIIPSNPTSSAGQSDQPGKSKAALGTIIGVFLVAVGGILLLENLDIINWWKWWDTFWDFAVPALLIAAGVFFLMRPRSSGQDSGTPEEAGAAAPRPEEPKRQALRRSSADRRMFGVCGGLAVYFKIDPAFVRIAFIFFSLWPFGLGVALYLVLLLIMPEEQRVHPQPS